MEGNRFDKEAATWDEKPRRVQLARSVADEIARRIPLSRERDVLDFGCGTGLLTLALQPLVRRVTGADTSAGMLDVLRAKVRELGLANVATILLEEGAPPSFPPDRSDLVVSSMALHHVEDLAQLFRAFHAHLHPHGQVALADLDCEDGTFHEDPRDVFHLGFDRDEIEALLADAGFVDLAVTTAAVTHKNGRDYPVFLVTGTRRG